jgi:AcrR family transcriptional regulator
MTDSIATTPTKRPSGETLRIDGRRLRSERTKQLIIEAYLALAYENSPRVPTAAEIARRAGYSVRSVFERFPDINALQVAAVDYAMVQVAALAPEQAPPENCVVRAEHTGTNIFLEVRKPQ